MSFQGTLDDGETVADRLAEGQRQQGEEFQEEPGQIRTPALSVGERLLPYIFITAAVLIVVALTAYTLWYLGLR
jgi:hypothetical protein